MKPCSGLVRIASVVTCRIFGGNITFWGVRHVQHAAQQHNYNSPVTREPVILDLFAQGFKTTQESILILSVQEN